MVIIESYIYREPETEQNAYQQYDDEYNIVIRRESLGQSTHRLHRLTGDNQHGVLMRLAESTN